MSGSVFRAFQRYRIRHNHMNIKMHAVRFIIRNKTKSIPHDDYHRHGCCLIHYQPPLLKDCFILCQDTHPPKVSEDDFMQFTLCEAQRLSKQITNSPQNFILIMSGVNIRKRENWHAHIFIVKNRWQKAYTYQLLAVKNLSLSLYSFLTKNRS